MKKILLITTFLFVCLSLHAELRLKYPTGDHMVLQQQSQAAVFGFATPGALISVTPSWDNETYIAKADSKGHWAAYVPTPAASYTVYTINVKGDGATLNIQDVLVGEVWMASGQSNMEMPIKGFDNCPVKGYNEIITQAPARDKIRMLYIRTVQADEPQEEVTNTDGWYGADPNSIPEMSAVGYFFARKLNEVLDIPVGVVAFARGGARVEGWLPKETVAAFGEDVSPEAVKQRMDMLRPYEMYNGMQAPIQGYTARGFIWYQGCSNVGHEDEFVPRMVELVRQWRSDWRDIGNKMPFYMVEITPYSNHNGTGAALRKAQHDVAKQVENCGIICTNDLVAPYEAANIHPCDKESVGNRLAYLALNRDYGFTRIACDAPEAVALSKMQGFGGFGRPGGNAAAANVPPMTRVEIVNCPHGIDRTQEIEGLEACGPDGVWHKVDHVMYFRGSMIIPTDDVLKEVSEVRYGWADFMPGNIHSIEGLPLVPFWLKAE
ncbi:MAG: sialate O-acetylesterase [Bacteroidales bacterium]|nr:sialate O-acetylesterase [Bacteroidales bacterium]